MKRHAYRCALSVAALTVGCLTVAASAAAGAAPPASAPTGGGEVAVALGLSSSGGLSAVSADSSTDAWAVGQEYVNSAWHALILHWDGTGWRRVAHPGAAIQLAGVSALSPTDAWAAGTGYDGMTYYPVILHWDGTHWTKVHSPNPGGIYGGELKGMTALSATNIWAVGQSYGSHPTGEENNSKPFAEHWDGSSWTRSPVPYPASAGRVSVLSAVSGDASDDVWAVGTSWRLSGHGGVNWVVTEHWDGTSWTRVHQSLNTCMGSGTTWLNSVSVVGSHAYSGAECDFAGGQHPEHPLMAGWDGTGWTETSFTDPTFGYLFGVTALSSNDIWAVGNAYNEPLLMHSDGSSWATVAGGTTHRGTMRAVSALSATDVWAVGASQAATRHGDYVLIEHWDGSTWTQVPGA